LVAKPLSDEARRRAIANVMSPFFIAIVKAESENVSRHRSR
jgi:hypothetical protein